MRDIYIYPIDECDVLDKESLTRFRDKRIAWVDALDDDTDHAIWQTLSQMVWREVTYDAIANIADRNPGSAFNNRVIGESILDGHVTLQVLAIRRLIDDRRDVISLTRLLRDVRSSRNLLTRENFICFDGLPYDYVRVQNEELAKHGLGVRWLDTTGPRAFGVSEMVHEHFDKLAGVTPDKRERSDLIRPELLDRVEAWMDASGAKEIATWSHAYLAHAGSQSSRQRIADYGLTGNKIKHAVRELARVAEALSANILYAGGRMHALMPTAQFDHFEFLDCAGMPKDALEVAAKRWHEVGESYDDALSDVDQKLFAP